MIFSIIIPFYNCESYISETLESLFNQCTNEVEVILINDGSNDNSINIINDEFTSKDKELKKTKTDETEKIANYESNKDSFSENIVKSYYDSRQYLQIVLYR